MLEPSSSEEDEDYEPSSGIQNNVKDNNLKPPVANGGPRPVSPSTTDGKAGGKVNIQIFGKMKLISIVILRLTGQEPALRHLAWAARRDSLARSWR